MPFIQRLGLQGLLSFPPEMEPIDLHPLNVLIGPNGSGKTNVIEALELLRAAPTNLGTIIQSGGGAKEWLWKGDRKSKGKVSVNVEGGYLAPGLFLYLLEIGDGGFGHYVSDEKIEKIISKPDREKAHFIFRWENGEPVITLESSNSGSWRTERKLKRESFDRDESILSQIKEPSLYPVLSSISLQFREIRMFREWVFGTSSDLRLPQRIDDPSDVLLPDARNLALVVNEIHHRDHRAFDSAMKCFLPRYERMSTHIHGGTIQLFLHESGLRDPIPSTRISDGTLRFLAMLAVILSPSPPPLLCLEEPELGIHPDAITLLGELLIEASSRMQLVVTTHSDALLSALGNRVEAILVCENDGHGTRIERLDPGRLAFWLKDYTLGDIWRTGEIGGNP